VEAVKPDAIFFGYILNSIAMVFLYSTFVCLALFFMMIVYKCLNTLTPLKRKIIIILFMALDSVYLVAHIVYLINIKRYIHDRKAREDVEYNFLAVNGAMFILLDLIIVGSGSYLSYLMDVSNFKIPFFKHKFWILFFTIAIGILFFSRGLYYILFISDFEFDYINLEDQLSNQLQFIVILLILLWEIFPIILVVLMFWSIPKTSKSHLIPTPYSINSQQLPETFEDNSLLFNNIERYDSDEENPPLLNNQRINYGTNTKFFGYSTTSKLESH